MLWRKGRQVNESCGVGGISKGLLAKNCDYTHNPVVALNAWFSGLPASISNAIDLENLRSAKTQLPEISLALGEESIKSRQNH
jgi:hypothetical protein